MMKLWMGIGAGAAIGLALAVRNHNRYRWPPAEGCDAEVSRRDAHSSGSRTNSRRRRQSHLLRKPARGQGNEPGLGRGAEAGAGVGVRDLL